MAFDSEEQDPRDYLKTEYYGRTLHIKPGHGDTVSLISTFLEDNTKYADVLVTPSPSLTHGASDWLTCFLPKTQRRKTSNAANAKTLCTKLPGNWCKVLKKCSCRSLELIA
jgi:hypothetical protein